MLDLASRVFGPGKVTCFFMYFLPGLECVQEGLDFARQRYGVEVLQLPHWNVFRLLKGEVYCDASKRVEELPEVSEVAVREWVRRSTGIPTCATGEKRADGGIRRHLAGSEPGVVRPLLNWNKFDLIGYMKARAIPQPRQDSRNSAGVDLSTKSLLWLFDTYPHDFERIEAVFPYVRAVVKRREWYGVS